jgi:hypothetical protein
MSPSLSPSASASPSLSPSASASPSVSPSASLSPSASVSPSWSFAVKLTTPEITDIRYTYNKPTTRGTSLSVTKPTIRTKVTKLNNLTKPETDPTEIVGTKPVIIKKGARMTKPKIRASFSSTKYIVDPY